MVKKVRDVSAPNSPAVELVRRCRCYRVCLLHPTRERSYSNGSFTGTRPVYAHEHLSLIIILKKRLCKRNIIIYMRGFLFIYGDGNRNGIKSTSD